MTLSAVLFPHAGLSEPELGKILSLFASLEVCLPWQMEPSEVLARDLPAGCVAIHRPPAELDPGKTFLRALSEYREWVRNHLDRSGLDLIKSGAGPDEEDPVWEIRGRIRQQAVPAPQRGGEETFRWHLVLHLAREIEEQRDEADRILDALRQARSPLEGLTEDPDEMRNLFEDLPGFDWMPEAGGNDLTPVVQAWLGLFGAALEPGGLLLTLDRRFADLLTSQWSEAAGPSASSPPVLRFPFPDLSDHPLERIPDIRREHLSDAAVRELHGILAGLGSAFKGDLEDLAARASELADFCPVSACRGRVNCTAVALPPLPETVETSPGLRPPGELAGRTLLFLEGAP